MLGRPREERQVRFLTLASLRWVIRHRAWSPWYLVRYWRFLVFRLRNPHIITTGMVFIGRRVEIYARRGYGRIVLGRWVHLGDENRLRCHEGSLVVGDKCVFGRGNTVNPRLLQTGFTSATSTTSPKTSTYQSRTKASSSLRCA